MIGAFRYSQYQFTCYSAILYMGYILYYMYNIAIYLAGRKRFVRIRFGYINNNPKHIMVPKNVTFTKANR